MDAGEQRVLENLRFDVVPTEEAIWQADLPHVRGINQKALDLLQNEIRVVRDGVEAHPRCLVFRGEFGVGKTHLAGLGSSFTNAIEGYVVNIDLAGEVGTLWPRARDSILRCLHKVIDTEKSGRGPTTQLTRLMRGLTTHLGLDEPARAVLCGEYWPGVDEARDRINAFADAVRELDSNPLMSDVAVALALLAVRNRGANAVGRGYLINEVGDVAVRRSWGLGSSRPDSAVDIVRYLSTIMAVTGPTLFIVDQIDELVVLSRESTAYGVSQLGKHDLAYELMHLRDKLSRSVTAIFCFEHTWQTVLSRTVASAPDRFQRAVKLEPIVVPDVGRELVAQFLAPQFKRLGFKPLYATWPIPPKLFGGIAYLRPTPRRLLQLVENYIRCALEAGQLLPVAELSDLVGLMDPAPVSSSAGPREQLVYDRFRELLQSVDVEELKTREAEARLGRIVHTATRALMVEAGLTVGYRVRDTGRGDKMPATHCAIVAPEGREIHLRGVNVVAAAAIGRRVDLACGSVDPHRDDRLLIVATANWGETSRVFQARGVLDDVGGRVVQPSERELRLLGAIHRLAGELRFETLSEWLQTRRPLSETDFGIEVIKTLSGMGAMGTFGANNSELRVRS